MKRMLVACVALLIVCMALPAAAQEEAVKKEAAGGSETFKPLAPIDDAFLDWMVGEWQGWTKSSMGETLDYMKCEMGFGGQFFIMHYKSSIEGLGATFTGMGVITVGEDGGLDGFWIDSRRTMSRGEGTREGDVMTMNWSDANGTYRRVTEKIDEDTFRIKSTVIGPEDMKMETVSEMKRLK